MTSPSEFVVIGIDLAETLRRPTGVCVFKDINAEARIALTGEDILDVIRITKPDILPIDAPLTLPVGQTSIYDLTGEHLRVCDRELQRRKIRFFPVTLGPMRMLTERGLALKAQIEALGYRAVECYPGAAQDIWGLPRQRHDLPGLLLGLRQLGLRG